MKFVGDKLLALAKKETDDSHRNLLARSAVNRYYYACFLEVRELINHCNPKRKDDKFSHANVPEELASYFKRFCTNKERSRALKKNTILMVEFQTHKNILLQLSQAIAQTLNTLRNARTTADYEPDVLIKKHQNSFFLKSTKISAYKHETKTLLENCHKIRRAWEQCNDY